MKVAVYARVSTTDQHCQVQLTELRRYTEARGWEIAQEYIDQGVSGAKSSRPALNHLMQDALTRQIDTIVVYKIDRFGRSVRDLVNNIESLSAAGVRFIAITQGIDTDASNPASKLLLHILSAIAEFERELIRERVTAGLKAAKQRGTRSGRAIGRPVNVFDREKARQLKQDGLSLRQIASQLGVPTATVMRGLRAIRDVQ
jgi:putative DNA-invertase from lambdoid prophage Rac